LRVAVLLLAALAATGCGASKTAEPPWVASDFGPAAGGLCLRIAAPKTAFEAWECIEIRIEARNATQENITVPPGSVQMSFDGPGADCMPYPDLFGPRYGARLTLAPGRSAVIATLLPKDHGDSTGLWTVKPGAYAVRATFDTRNPFTGGTPDNGAWTGEITSGALGITVVENSAIYVKLSETLAPLMWDGAAPKVREALLALGPEADAELLLMMRDKGPGGMQGHAIQALAMRQVRAAVPELIARLEGERGTINGVVVAALGEMADRRAAGPLAALMPRAKPWNGDGGAAILIALRKIGDPQSVAVFERYADSEDYRVAGQALAGLEAVGHRDVVTPLIKDILAKDSPTRELSLERLYAMGELAAPRLIRFYLGTEDPDTVRTIGGFFLRIISERRGAEREISAAAIEKMKSKDPANRQSAVFVLRYVHRPEVKSALERALKDPDGSVRTAAAAVIRDNEEQARFLLQREREAAGGK
jgi:HEAT repeat protein